MSKQLAPEEVKDLERRHKIALEALGHAVKWVGIFKFGGAHDLWSECRAAYLEAGGKRRFKK